MPIVSSTLLGYPKTGRMHQIRVHLQWLGMLSVVSMVTLHICILIDEKYLVHYQSILILTAQQNVRILDIVKVLVVENFYELLQISL